MNLEGRDSIRQPRRPMNVFDGFCGCGGLSNGFLQAGGFRIVAACEMNPHAARTYRLNHPGTDVIVGDIRDDRTKGAIRAAFAVEPCDVIVAGIPCQAYTKSKHRDPNDPRGKLYEPFIDVVGKLMPALVVIENVPDIMTMRHADGALVVEKIASSLRRIGYAVGVRILNAADFGVAQRRRRAFIFAWREGSIPRPVKTHDEHGGKGLPKWLTIRDAIGDLEEQPEDNAWSHVSPRHGHEVLDRISRTPIGGKASVGYNEGAYRDAPDRPSRTLRGGAWIVHYRHDRVITVREGARIQGFPDGFLFSGPKSEQTLMVGNAVPPSLAKAVALAVSATLDERSPIAWNAPSSDQELPILSASAVHSSQANPPPFQNLCP